MFKKFIPYCHAKNIYEVDPNFFVKQGVKLVLIDLDNTLDSFKVRRASVKTINFINSLKNYGLTPVVISNNKENRVKDFANDLKIDFVANAKKPFSKKILNTISKRNLKPDDVMLVGDQMMTDVQAAHKAGLRMVLCNKLVKEDQWTTHINRIFGRRIKKYLQKRNKLVDWRNK